MPAGDYDKQHAQERYGEPLAPGALSSPAAERNKEPILAVLRRVLPASGVVLEIASGTGQHAEHFARSLPSLVWQPTEPDAELRAAIAARVTAAGLPNLRAPLALDVESSEWPLATAAAIVCINMIHIAPWSATEALFVGARRLLEPGSILVLYGPYRRVGVPTAPSNEAFDASLRRRNAEWGVRDLETVAELAAENAFELRDVVDMPAHNVTVIFARRPEPPPIAG